MTEQAHVWAPLRRNTPVGVHWNRIENTAGTGMADLNGCHRGVEVWIENKIYKGNRVEFRPTQPGWIMTRRMAGGRVFVLARKDDSFLLYDGGRVLQLAEQGIGTPALFVTNKHDGTWDWGGLLCTIFGHTVD